LAQGSSGMVKRAADATMVAVTLPAPPQKRALLLCEGANPAERVKLPAGSPSVLLHGLRGFFVPEADVTPPCVPMTRGTKRIFSVAEGTAPVAKPSFPSAGPAVLAARPPAGAVAVALFGRQGFFVPESLVELAAAEAGAAYPSSFGQATQMIPEMPGVMSDGMEELGDKPTLYTTSGESNRRVHGQKRAFAVASEMWSDA